MADRPKIGIKAAAPARDPRRKPVRATTAPFRAFKDLPRDEAPAARPERAPRRSDAQSAPRAAPRPGPRPGPRPEPRPTSGPAKPPAPVHAAPLAPPPASPNRRVAPAAHPEGVRISKLITERGLASRREADDWIAAGWVRVDGKMAVLGQRVPVDQHLDIDARASVEQARQMTVLLNKPVGYVSGQAEDGYEPAIALVTPGNRWAGDASGVDYHPGHLRHLAPAGRLDIDSTGLLVLTQDGRVARQLIGENSTVDKEYLVRVEGNLDERGLALLNHGLTLDDKQLKPAKVGWANDDQLRFVLNEGRKRQIRRMCELVGLRVTALKRVRIGRIRLGELPLGEWRFLRPGERF